MKLIKQEEIFKMNYNCYAFVTDNDISTEVTITCKKTGRFMYRRTHGYVTQKTSTSKTQLCFKPCKLYLHRDSKKKKLSHGKYELYYISLC